MRRRRPDVYSDTLGVLMEDGERWHDVRSKVQQDLMRPKSALYYIDELQQVGQDFVTYLRNIRDPNDFTVKNTLLEAHRFAFEGITLVALDTRLGCLKVDIDPELSYVMDAVEKFLESFPQILTSLPTWKILPPRWNKVFRETEDHFQVLLDFGKAKIEAATEKIKEKQMTEQDADADISVLEKMILRNGKDSKVPIVMAIDMIFAGIDTTGNSLAYLLYNLAQNPDKQEKLRQECIQMGDTLDARKIEQMKYFKACMRESFRLTPTIPNMARLIKEDAVIAGYNIPRDTMVMWSKHMLSQDKEQFPDWEEFKPERWLGRDHGICPYAVRPFSKGPRMCIGKRFAELELQLVTHRLLKNFDIKWVTPEPLTLSQVLVNNPDQSMDFQFKDLN